MAKKLLPIIFIAFSLIFFTVIPTQAQHLKRSFPQITFGDILNNTYQNKLQTIPENSLTKQKKIQELLALIEKNGRESLNNFNKNGIPKKASTSDSLTENIAGYFITPVPTLAPKLAQILEQVDRTQLITSREESDNLGGSDVLPQKSNYTVAFLGDSMTETLGENLPNLASFLNNEYPKNKFTLLNYGQGATNIEDGLYRLTNPTKYLNRDYPPLLHLNPDIIVVESFAYNHWSGELDGLNRQWSTAVQILETIRNYSKDINIVLLATISPNPKIFADGKLNWTKDQKWDAAITTKAYLLNFINFANAANLPLADAYTSSFDKEGLGDPKYINPADNLHPSEEGKQLIAEKIFAAIKNNNLIK